MPCSPGPAQRTSASPGRGSRRSPPPRSPPGKRRPRRRGRRRPSVRVLGRPRHRRARPGVLRRARFCGLSNYYTLRYAPIVDGERGRAALPALIEGLRARPPRYAVLHLEPLAADAPLTDDLAQALGAAGLVTRRYLRSGNWHDDTEACPSATISPASRRCCATRSGAGLAPGAGGLCTWPSFAAAPPSNSAGSIRAGVRHELEASRAPPPSSGALRLASPRRGASTRSPSPRQGPHCRAALDRLARPGDPVQARPRAELRRPVAGHGADHAHARVSAR